MNSLATRCSVGDAVGVSAQPVLRPITVEDAQDVLDLAVLSDIAEVGEVSTTLAEIEADAASDRLFAVGIDDPDGGLVAYAWVEHPPEMSKVYADVVLRPGSGPDIAQPLLDWSRQKATEIAPELTLYMFADSGNRTKNRLFDAAGGRVVRTFYRMAIDLDPKHPVEVPPLAAGVAIRGVSAAEADLRAMYHVIDTAFLDHVGGEHESYEEWLRQAVSGSTADMSLWWLATVDGEPASALYAAERPTSGYVDTLGTLREHRGRGLGRALLLTAFAEFQRRGYHRVVLGVDASSPTGALGLYESAGMRVANEGWRYEFDPLHNDATAS
jgi:ribosomal protein S18 acetylase RimI-like enzyme